MLHVWPSMIRFLVGCACNFATASSSNLSASGLSVERSKSKYTYSKFNSTIGARGRTTWTLTVDDALPPLPSVTVTVSGTVPSKSDGAVHCVVGAFGVEKVPTGAVQR